MELKNRTKARSSWRNPSPHTAGETRRLLTRASERFEGYVFIQRLVAECGQVVLMPICNGESTAVR